MWKNRCAVEGMKAFAFCKMSIRITNLARRNRVEYQIVLRITPWNNTSNIICTGLAWAFSERFQVEVGSEIMNEVTSMRESAPLRLRHRHSLDSSASI